jgi:choline kinase
MNAVIVAAGEGKRLRPITDSTPKCLLRIGGKSLISRSVEYLLNNGVGKIFIVIGYKKEQIIRHMAHYQKRIEYIFNPYYSINNNMASLWFAKPFVYEKLFLYLHADLLYHPDIIKQCIHFKKDTALMVDSKKCGQEEMKVRMSEGLFVESSKDLPLNKTYGEWLGINKFSSVISRHLFDEIDDILYKANFMAYDTYALNNLAKKGIELPVCDAGDLPWIEIDTAHDLKLAENEIYISMKKMGVK